MNQKPFNSFQPLKSLSLSAIIGLAIVISLNVLTIVAGIVQIISPGWNINFRGLYYPVGFLLISVIASVKVIVYILTVIFFLIWLNRANKNLSALGVENQEFSSGWAVGWWFIPFASLVKPYQVVREIWNESDPDINPEHNFLSGGAAADPGFMAWWWFFWITSNITANLSSQIVRFDPVGSLGVIPYVFILSSLLSIIAGLLVIKIVIGITERQKERFERMSALGNIYHQPPQPPTFN